MGRKAAVCGLGKGAGEKAQWLGGLTVLAEDSSSRRSSVLFWTLNLVHTQTEFKKTYYRGWRDGSAVRALATLPEDPGSVPSTHTVTHNRW